MKTTQITISLILAAFLSFSSACQSYGLNNPTIEKAFKVNGPGDLIVESSSGQISVHGTDQNEVIVETYITKNGKPLATDDDLVKNLQEGFDIVFQQDENEIIIKAKRTSKGKIWRQVSVSFKISVPIEMSTDLQSSGGGIKIDSLIGNHQINTSGGGLKIMNITGDIEGRTSGGGITVGESKGEINIQTSGGGIDITNSEGNILASTSGGGIKLINVKGKVDVHTSGGPIELEGEMEAIKARTSGGGITAKVTGVTEKLYLETSGGGIYARLPATLGMNLDVHGNGVNVPLKNFDGFAKGNKIVGNLNGGGIPVYMHSSGGGVTVDFQ